MRFALVMLIATVLGMQALAQAEMVTPGSEIPGREIVKDDHPDLSVDAPWAGRVVRGILVLFLAAAVVGPLVKSKPPAEPPPAHGQDDDAQGGAVHH